MVRLEDLKKINKEVTKAAISLGQSASHIIQERAFTMLDEAELAKRVNICHECPFYIKDAGKCDVCGCMVALKAPVKQFRCPIGKWEPDQLPESWSFNAGQIQIVAQAFFFKDGIIHAFFKNEEGIHEVKTTVATNQTEIQKCNIS